MSITYKDAGVDTHEGQRAVKLMKEHVKSTFTSGVLGELGSFSGLFKLPSGYQNPVLVSGTDGVGTKLKLAFELDRHDTVGIDLVAMCINDILCQGARPLFFLDYIATGKVVAEKIADIVKGIATGCKLAGASLIGGETAEMPGFYDANEYDLAGFAVGIVEEDKIITGKDIKKGDLLLSLPSSGLHSNGFSLARKVLSSEYYEEMLTPTRIYAKEILSLIDHDLYPKGIVHMTGGGFYENIPRVLPEGLGVFIQTENIPSVNIFTALHQQGISKREMYSTFNMGVGMILFADEKLAEKIMNLLPEARIIGVVEEAQNPECVRFDEEF